MFGVLRGAGCSMKPEEQAHWMNHICGVCLALRDQAGHAARITTNYDAALLSVLCEAQSEAPTQQTTSCCPLRGSRFRAEVVAPENAGAKYAASIALTAGAVKIDDHVDDGETVLRHAPRVARAVGSMSWPCWARIFSRSLRSVLVTPGPSWAELISA